MSRLAVWATVLCCASTLVAASPQRRGTKAAPPKAAPTVKATTQTCAAELGNGASSGRRFCDVIIATKAEESVAVAIPPHRGTAKLLFDVHNRVAVPPERGQVLQSFARNAATIAVVGPKGEIGRGAAVSEFRTVADPFDRILGGAPGVVKAVAPGPATAIDITVPAAVNSIGIVGVRLDVVTRLGPQRYDTPGRPIAIVSNLRVEYTPLR